jgi:predicted CoA-binding protein
MRGKRLGTDQELGNLLDAMRTVAVVGLSPRPDRPSHQVASYLQAQGYRVRPVHPGEPAILGEPAVGSLAQIEDPGSVDVVNVFRRPDALPALVDEAKALGIGTLWFQLGVTHPEAEAAALDAGIDLVVDRCLLVEHRRLRGG